MFFANKTNFGDSPKSTSSSFVLCSYHKAVVQLFHETDFCSTRLNICDANNERSSSIKGYKKQAWRHCGCMKGASVVRRWNHQRTTPIARCSVLQLYFSLTEKRLVTDLERFHRQICDGATRTITLTETLGRQRKNMTFQSALIAQNTAVKTIYCKKMLCGLL